MASQKIGGNRNRNLIIYCLVFLAAVGVSHLFYNFVIYPQYPYLILDKNSPIPNDPQKIYYLPIEITKDSSNTKVYRACSFPMQYDAYIHNRATGDWNPLNVNGIAFKIIPWLLLALIGGYITYDVLKRRLKRRKHAFDKSK